MLAVMLTPFVLLAQILGFVWLIRRARKQVAFDEAIEREAVVLASLVMGWAVVCAGLSFSGLLQSKWMLASLPALWMPAITLLIAIVGTLSLPAWRKGCFQALDAIPTQAVLGLHALRIGSLPIAFMGWAGQLSAPYTWGVALPEGLFGLSAVAILIWSYFGTMNKWALVAWHVIGALMVLYSGPWLMQMGLPGPLQLFGDGVNNLALLRYPLVLSPIMIMPLAVVLHVWHVIYMLRRSEWFHGWTAVWGAREDAEPWSWRAALLAPMLVPLAWVQAIRLPKLALPKISLPKISVSKPKSDEDTAESETEQATEQTEQEEKAAKKKAKKKKKSKAVIADPSTPEGDTDKAQEPEEASKPLTSKAHDPNYVPPIPEAEPLVPQVTSKAHDPNYVPPIPEAEPLVPNVTSKAHDPNYVPPIPEAEPLVPKVDSKAHDLSYTPKVPDEQELAAMAQALAQASVQFDSGLVAGAGVTGGGVTAGQVYAQVSQTVTLAQPAPPVLPPIAPETVPAETRSETRQEPAFTARQSSTTPPAPLSAKPAAAAEPPLEPSEPTKDEA